MITSQLFSPILTAVFLHVPYPFRHTLPPAIYSWQPLACSWLAVLSLCTCVIQEKSVSSLSVSTRCPSLSLQLRSLPEQPLRGSTWIGG